MQGRYNPQSRPIWSRWRLLDEISKTPLQQYGLQNNTYFTAKISYGANFISNLRIELIPSHILYVDYLNVRLISMQTLDKLSFRLGYETRGRWYYTNISETGRLEMMPLLDSYDIIAFADMIKRNHLEVVEQLYVEHIEYDPRISTLHPVMTSPARRMEKLIHILIQENKDTSIETATTFVEEMIGFKFSNAIIAKYVDKAKETRAA